MNEITELALSDDNYPTLLKEITDPPELLYVRGNPEILNHPWLLAVVGSRRASYYGQQIISKIFTPLVQLQIPLVSGLAYGVDSLAHRICLDNKTPTIAILGSGINDKSIYPTKHLLLARQIIENGGAIVSEYPVDSPPLKHNFPERNRIIAGLCRATIVIQAATKSGSLITARLALESNRDVAAVPGPITDPLSAGTNLLIQQGAAPILTPQDALDLLGFDATAAKTKKILPNLTEQQRKVITVLSATPTHFDQISAETKLPTPTLSVTLTELELLNITQHIGGMKYVKTM